MTCDISPWLVHDSYVEDHRIDQLRSGEGCITELKDGRLFFIYGRFVGGSDFDKAILVQRFSSDGGRTWTEAQPFLQTPDEAINNMSVSMLPMHDGRLMVVYLQKNSKTTCIPMFCISSDEARTWSMPRRVVERDGYYIVNNDRVIQLRSGRILIPFHRLDHAHHRDDKGELGCFYSDDAGQSWQAGQGIRLLPEQLITPKLGDPRSEAWKKVFAQHLIDYQEPGVIERNDGSVMLWCRTNAGYAYRTLSYDQGQSWSAFEPISEFAQPCGPQSIVKLPGWERFIMIYNDREQIPFEHHQFQWRRPLAAAVSDDQGLTWRRLGLLEPDTLPSTCYCSQWFHQGNLILSYYAGNMVTSQESKLYVPANLRSLKVRIIRQDYFQQ